MSSKDEGTEEAPTSGGGQFSPTVNLTVESMHRTGSLDDPRSRHRSGSLDDPRSGKYAYLATAEDELRQSGKLPQTSEKTVELTTVEAGMSKQDKKHELAHPHSIRIYKFEDLSLERKAANICEAIEYDLPDLLKFIREVAAPSDDAPCPRMVEETKHKDLRSLDLSFNEHDEPSVIVRRHVILVSMSPYRVVITSTHFLLVLEDGADDEITTVEHMLDKIASERMNHVIEKTKILMVESLIDDPSTPWEIRAFEGVLRFVIAKCDSQVEEYKEHAKRLDAEYKRTMKKSSIIPYKDQDEMRNLRTNISKLLLKLESHQKWLDELLKDEEKMALMNLTRLKSIPNAYSLPLTAEVKALHNVVELSLDLHLRNYNVGIFAMRRSNDRLTNAVEEVSMKLDHTKNEILKINTILTIVSTGLTFGGYIAGIFGMNLDNTEYLQPVPGVFMSVCIVTSALIIFGVGVTILYFMMKDKQNKRN